MNVLRTGLSARVARFFGSQWCMWVVFALFVIQAAWLAVSAAYPMAFDEQYHFGLIQLHAQQWLPFLTHQPPTGLYGSVSRDPSYLYHWLMSFPYRLTSLFTHDQTIQVIVLRLINVVMFTYAILLFRRVMRRLGLSEALTNVSLLLFVLVPVVPYLAATINYDNLVMVAVPWSILLTLDVFTDLCRGTVSLARVIVLASVLLLGCLVKYPFLPVLVVSTLFLLVTAWRHRIFTVHIWSAAWRHLRVLAVWQQVLLCLFLLLSLGLFTERYGVNIVRYHTPIPACDQVISQQQCMEYGPWDRDYNLKQTKPSVAQPSPVTYIGPWLYGMWYRLFFAIGPQPGYDTQPPLYVVSLLAVGLTILLALGVVIRWRTLFVGRPERLFLLLILLCYGLALFADNLREYLVTNETVAINGRYWIPFLPLFFILGGLAWSGLLKRLSITKTWTAGIVVTVFLLQGGGAMTFIIRSNDTWYWPNATIRRINGDIRHAAAPVIIDKSDVL